MTKRHPLDRIYRNAVAAHQAGDLINAAKGYRNVLEKNYTHLPSLNNLAAVLSVLGKNSEAKKCYEKGLSEHPESPELLANYGNLLRQMGDLEGAAKQYAICLETHPTMAEIRYALGIVLLSIGCPDESKIQLQQAAEDLSNDPRPWIALAALALDLGHNDEADKTIAQALELSPCNADVHNMVGLVAKARGEFTRSLSAFEKALTTEPNHAEARFNRGTILLLTGEMLNGWKDLEWRWKNRSLPPWAPSQIPKWESEDLNRKTILVLGEQGLGDTIQFIRYAPFLRKLGARVIVQCRKPLLRLVASAPGVDEVVQLKDEVVADFWTPIMSLPCIFRTTEAIIPAASGYFNLPIISNRRRKPYKIGLVWAGSPSHKNDTNRSMTLDALTPITKLTNYKFFSLQTGERRKDLNQKNEYQSISDIMAGVIDFKDTTDRLSNIDLLITIDTAIAHLAGAVGLTTFLLLPKVPDWRWMLDRNDTPWYHSVRIFRQRKIKNWHDPINSILDVLENW